MALQNASNGKAILSATDRLVGRQSAGGGLSEEIICTAAGRSLLAAIDAAAQRVALALGSAALLTAGAGAGNVPVLDGADKLLASTIPTVALTSIQVVADQAARLALVNVEPGDVAKQTDNGLSYILSALPASTNANWISLGDTAIDASDITSGILPFARGGTGLGALGSALQLLRVDAGGTALEYFTPATTLNRLFYTEVTTTTQTLVADNAYGANNASQVVATLPVTAAAGAMIEITGMGAGGWRIAQNASQQIHFGNLSTTVGTGGRIDSTLRRDCIRLKCVVANTEWVVVDAVGNLDVV
jgi:hypothetical protein